MKNLDVVRTCVKMENAIRAMNGDDILNEHLLENTSKYVICVQNVSNRLLMLDKKKNSMLDTTILSENYKFLSGNIRVFWDENEMIDEIAMENLVANGVSAKEVHWVYYRMQPFWDRNAFLKEIKNKCEVKNWDEFDKQKDGELDKYLDKTRDVFEWKLKKENLLNRIDKNEKNKEIKVERER